MKLKLGYLAIFSFLVMTTLVLFRIKGFNVWPQIEYIYINYISSMDEFFSFIRFSEHPHSLRFLIMFPLIHLADIYHLDINVFFGFFCVSFLLLYKMWFIRQMGSNPFFNWVILGYFLALDLVVLKMNGRFIPVLLSMPCIFIFMLEERKIDFIHESLIVSLSLVFAGVSSGTFTIVFVSYVCTKLISFLKSRKRDISKLYALTIVLFFFTMDQYRFLEKNIKYFSGNLIGLFEHGIAKFIPFLSSVPFSLLIATMGIIGFTIIYFCYNRLKLHQLKIVVILIISGAISMFGVGTMFVAVISLLGAATIYLSNIFDTCHKQGKLECNFY